MARSEFLTFDTIDILGQKVLWGGPSCMLNSSILGFFHQMPAAFSHLLLPKCVTTKNVSRHCQMSPWGKNQLPVTGYRTWALIHSAYPWPTHAVLVYTMTSFGEPTERGLQRNLSLKGKKLGTSLLVQWIRIWEDFTCRGATKPLCHNHWAQELQLLACMP